jgi:glycerophosphoryl diester phosphodiesterase
MEDFRNQGYARILKRFIKVKPWPQNALALPAYQAHRGAWFQTGLQENTLTAFRMAKKLGAQMVELDVQLSKDNVPVVYHDETLTRLTGGEFQSRIVEMSAFDLQSNHGVATLEQVLRDQAVPPFFNIEIKSLAISESSLERRVFSVIQRTAFSSRVLISSFNPFSLLRFDDYSKGCIPLALLVAKEMENRLLRDMWLAPFLPIHLLHLQETMLLTPSDVDQWLNRGVPLAVWTVNSAARALQLLEQGVASIISDLPIQV